MKLFTYPELATFKRTFLDRSFEDVFVSKPEASRKESSEIYWVCVPLPSPLSPPLASHAPCCAPTGRELTQAATSGVCRCKGFKGDVVGELIAPPAPEEQQQWADT